MTDEMQLHTQREPTTPLDAPEIESDPIAGSGPRPIGLDDALGFARRVSVRSWVRVGFLGVFLYACWQLWSFYQWAIGVGPYVPRPEAVAGLVPLGALMSLIAWLKSGLFDPVMPASVVIVLAALVISMLFKRGFCGYVCPVGTVVSAFGWLGRKLNGGRPRRVPVGLDRALRVPKYLLAAAVVGYLATLPVQVALEFQLLPYYATADMKILWGVLHPAWGYWVVAGFVVGTTLWVGTNTWCRYLCPLGAMYGAASVASLGTVKRDAERCIDCKACDKACAATIEVSSSTRAVRSAECDGCQECVSACPVPGALESRVAGVTIPWRAWAVLLVLVWLVVWAIAYASGHWQHGLPDDALAELMRTMKLTHDF